MSIIGFVDTTIVSPAPLRYLQQSAAIGPGGGRRRLTAQPDNGCTSAESGGCKHARGLTFPRESGHRLRPTQPPRVGGTTRCPGAPYRGRGTSGARYAETRYGAKSWKCERRVSARIEATCNGLDVRYVVTNIARASAEWLYDTLYCARDQAENLVKLHKSQLASDRTGCR